VEAPDLDRYPLFQQAAFTELVLGPGDMLFIPKVRSCFMCTSPLHPRV
jgi:hypothetical protein